MPNLRLIRFDAVAVLESMIPDASIAGFHIFFPDPWPKKKHYKRRLIQAPFAQLLAKKLIEGGYVYCVTDWEPYAQQMLEVFETIPRSKTLMVAMLRQYLGGLPQASSARGWKRIILYWKYGSVGCLNIEKAARSGFFNIIVIFTYLRFSASLAAFAAFIDFICDTAANRFIMVEL